MELAAARLKSYCPVTQDARDDVAMGTAEVREMNPGLTEEEVAAAVAQPQAALDAAVTEQEV